MNKHGLIYLASCMIVGFLSSCNYFEEPDATVESDAYLICRNPSENVKMSPMYYWHFKSSSSSLIDTAKADVILYGEFPMSSKDSTKTTFSYTSEQNIGIAQSGITVKFIVDIDGNTVTNYDLILNKDHIIKPVIFKRKSIEATNKYIYAAWSLPENNGHDNIDLVLTKDGVELFSLLSRGEMLAPETSDYLISSRDVFTSGKDTLQAGDYLLTLKTYEYANNSLGGARGINCLGLDTISVIIE
ncbi:MAG: hypothetical protein ACK5MG_08065 [Bacteroidales bacterium]